MPSVRPAAPPSSEARPRTPTTVGALGYPPKQMARQLPLTAIAYLNLQAAGEKRIKAMRHAADACATIWALAYANYKLDLGRWPTQAEYAEYWNISERSAQREWANFRNAFPTEEDPEGLARWFTSEVAARIEDRSTALTVTAPPELVPA